MRRETDAVAANVAQEQVLHQQVLQQSVSFHQGPIPPAQEIEALEHVYPGAAKLIFSVFEEQSKHRQSLESTKLNGDIRSERRGSWQGFAIAIFGLAVAGFLGYTGHDWAAGTIGTVDLGSLVTVFVLGRQKTAAELRAKAAAEHQAAAQLAANRRN